ncbi:uncharacterized protein LOC116413577 [Galleria mellonella]|uniref:Uncharacterized protein LOC116413577 n=1 Tax=Galleria mellonella TaxID=7137 RepID=A0ABM3MQT3_GALME|nr:uncharacterized protein LOC116413577 [Galleria mellonella]
MSSESSVATDTSSRIRQFGLYRTIDARTEEFLKLSRKRQIRQGCACAVVSTAITVAIIVVILLIYEYAIAVEWSLVQNRKSHRRSNNTIIVNDTPVADRLDRSYFGFDQDYYERMPLLVNAMQENSYIDPSIDIPMQKRGKYIDISHTNPIITTNEPKHTNSIRRTSPRPFIYEQRSPTPVPFSKTFRSKSWIESYRNAERLKNIQQIIRYLEKTINAKAGDMHGLPPSTHIAFSGVYVEPYNHNENKGFDESSSIDLLLESSNNVETIKSSQQSDPLFKYKPDRPGDVNLLADSYLRFIPTTAPKSLYNREYAKVPMFRPIPVPSQKKPFDLLQASSVNNNLNNKSINKAKTFSVMLNLYPLIPSLDPKAKINNIDSVKTEKSTPNNIYFTTSRPLFRRKSAIRRTSVSNKRPRMFNDYKKLKYKDVMFNSKDKTTDNNDPEKNANMIVKVNIYHADKAPKLFEKQENDTQTNTKALNLNNTVQRNFAPVTDMPMQLSTTQVEDHHLGSSGIIPVENRSVPSPVLPIVTTMIPFFDITPASTNTWPTNSPEILKFSPEDAKIPDQYINIKTNYNPHSNIFKIGRRSFSENIASNEKKSETRTLIIKLKNDSENVTEENTTQNKIKEETTTELSNDTTTKENQIKHINGHYRSKFITKQWLDPNSEANRKRRLQLFAKGFRRPNSNSSYIEIDRSNNNSHESNLKDTTSK